VDAGRLFGAMTLLESAMLPAGSKPIFGFRANSFEPHLPASAVPGTAALPRSNHAKFPL